MWPRGLYTTGYNIPYHQIWWNHEATRCSFRISLVIWQAPWWKYLRSASQRSEWYLSEIILRHMKILAFSIIFPLQWWCLKSPSSWVFTQPFVRAQIKENIKAQRWPVNSPHKGAVTRKMLSFDDVIMQPHDRTGRGRSSSCVTGIYLSYAVSIMVVDGLAMQGVLTSSATQWWVQYIQTWWYPLIGILAVRVA